MPNELKAGKAAIVLSIRGDVDAQLKKLEARVARFGETLSRVGRIGAQAAGAITAGFGAAAKMFTTAGDQLGKMSARTGVGTDALQELGFAAEQSGASLGAVGGAIQRMNRRLGRITAGQGTKTQVKAIEELGLSVEELEKMNAEERFLALGEAIKNYGDDAAAAGLAQRAFGTQVDALLPLFREGRAGIEALRAEFRELHGGMTEEQIAAAEALSNALGRVGSQIKALAVQVGAAVAGPLTDFLNSQTENIKGAIDWVRANQQTIVTTAKLSVAALAASTAILVAGQAVAVLSTAIAALRVAITFLTSHPLVAIITLIGAAIVAVLYWVGALDWLLERLGKLLGLASDSGAEVDKLNAKIDQLASKQLDGLGANGLAEELKAAADQADATGEKLDDLKLPERGEGALRDRVADRERAERMAREIAEQGFADPEGTIGAVRPRALFDASIASQVFGNDPQNKEETEIQRKQLAAQEALLRHVQRQRQNGIPVG